MQNTAHQSIYDDVHSPITQAARDWLGAPSAQTRAAETGGQGARAAETGRLAPSGGGQDREERGLSTVQTSQSTARLSQARPPFAQSLRTLDALDPAGMAPLRLRCAAWLAN
jgi:hypothetical protein